MNVRLLPVSLVLALAVGCATTGAIHPPNAATPSADVDPSIAVANIDANLARLNALEVVEVGPTLVLSGHAGNCYGIPCDDAEAKRLDAEREVAAVDLQTLTDLAVSTAAESTYAPAFDRQAVDADVAALDALDIVVVGTFAETVPANSANCYNTPCESDRQAAAATDATRAAVLHDLATRAVARFSAE